MLIELLRANSGVRVSVIKVSSCHRLVTSLYFFTERNPAETCFAAWPKVRPGVFWYQAIAKGVNENLASSVEVVVTGNGSALLGTIRRKLWFSCQ